MTFKHVIIYVLFLVFTTPLYSAEIEGDIKCYQDGQIIFDSQNRIRAFKAIDPMTQITEINLGQVEEVKVKIYASLNADVVCVVKEGN